MNPAQEACPAYVVPAGTIAVRLAGAERGSAARLAPLHTPDYDRAGVDADPQLRPEPMLGFGGG
jgi:hypothetical protein